MADTIKGAKINELLEVIRDWFNGKYLQVGTMPIAKAENEGRIVQFIGATAGTKEKGHFYKCQEVDPPTDPKTYEWVKIAVGNYYDKSETYTQTEVNDLIAGLSLITMSAVDELPTTGTANVIYLLKITGETYREQWIYADSTWTNIGNTEIDLSDYLKSNENGTITGNSDETPLTLKSYGSASFLGFKNSSGDTLGMIGVDKDGNPIFHDTEDKKLALKSVQTTVTLPTTGWASDEITVSCTGITEDSSVIVSPAPASIEEYASCGIYCIEQSEGSLKFRKRKDFDTALTVNILYS